MSIKKYWIDIFPINFNSFFKNKKIAAISGCFSLKSRKLTFNVYALRFLKAYIPADARVLKNTPHSPRLGLGAAPLAIRAS